MEPGWFHNVLWAPMEASTSDGGLPPKENPFRDLIEDILFTRWFILTYHYVILGLLLIFTILHWTRKAVRWRERRTSRLRTLRTDDAYDGDAETLKPEFLGSANNETPDGSSSGSSTLENTASSQLNMDEHSSLLQHGRTRRGTLFSSIKAFLMYQPEPISYINKTLPSNGTTILIAMFISLNIFYTFYRISLAIREIVVLAHRSGLIFVANLPVLYLLSAKNQPLKLLTGCSYESLNIIHRRLGELLCLEAFLHAVTMVITWYTLLRPTGFTLSRFLLERVILFGIGAFMSYEMLYLTSLASFRQRWYELFLGFHIFLQTAGLILLFFHHSGPSARLYLQIALGIVLVDRLVYRLTFKSIAIKATATVLKDRETVRLSMIIPQRSRTFWQRLVRHSLLDGWQAADHVFVTIPSLGRKHILQAHPFTIASPAPSLEDEQMHLTLLIRAMDGFSLDLLKKARHLEHCSHPLLNLRLDGPYGSSHPRTFLASSDLAILVAGGSGIAVVWPLVHYLLGLARSTDTEIIPTRILRRQTIVLIWVVHKREHMEWVSRENLKEVEDIGVKVVLPRATEEVGRPDLSSMIEDTVSLYIQKKGNENKKMRVVASGPDSMGRLVRNTCSGMVREGRNVDVTIEKFGW